MTGGTPENHTVKDVQHALLRAGVKIALALVVMFPLLTGVSRLQRSHGVGVAFLGFVVAIVIGLLAVENLAAIVTRRLSNDE